MPRPLACALSVTLVLSVSGLTGLFGVPSAMAQEVWRCQQAHGGALTYQAEPCHPREHLAGQRLNTAAPPAQAEQIASRKVAQREASLARTMARQRARHEKQPGAVHASLSGPVRQVSVGQSAAVKAHAHKRRARAARSDVFRAEVPGARRSARHQADAVAASPP